MLKKTAADFPEIAAQYSKNAEGVFEPVSYRELYETSLDFAAALKEIGVVRGEAIGLISDNRKEWEQADMGIMALGAVDVPRGCDATLIDLQQILSFTECAVVIAENAAPVKKIVSVKSELPHLKTLISFEDIGDGISYTFAIAPNALGKQENIRVDNLTNLLKGYFEPDGGQHLNVNVFDRKLLEDAMANPEKYPQLTIRVSGYAVNFVKLTKEQQMDVLSRTINQSM